ncbi:MAG: hypothetical protein PUP92_28025 [Rhizonema sp. PD38]|nr:hypothetical protein [Rhizonema sp. PD38]
MISAWETKEGSQRQLAQRFKVSLSFVRNLLRRYHILPKKMPLLGSTTVVYLRKVCGREVSLPQTLPENCCNSDRLRTEARPKLKCLLNRAFPMCECFAEMSMW